jgi:hypothetical protein
MLMFGTDTPAVTATQASQLIVIPAKAGIQ